MDDPNIVSFGTLDGIPTSTTWSYLTPAGHKVTATGAGMTFDGGGRAISGTASSIAIGRRLLGIVPAGNSGDQR